MRRKRRNVDLAAYLAELFAFGCRVGDDERGPCDCNGSGSQLSGHGDSAAPSFMGEYADGRAAEHFSGRLVGYFFPGLLYCLDRISH